MSADKPPPGQRLHRTLMPAKLGSPTHPGLVQLERERQRAADRQNRVADAITRFSGSMLFVYIHMIWFACWIAFGVEHYPYGLLTMIVSLEAIFLSTFVLISQNRADARRQVIADAQWQTVQEEDQQNRELLDISNQILALTREVRGLADSLADRSAVATLGEELQSLVRALGPEATPPSAPE